MKTTKTLYVIAFMGTYSQEMLTTIVTFEPTEGDGSVLLETIEIEIDYDESTAKVSLAKELENVKLRHLAEGRAKADAVDGQIQSLLALPNEAQ